VGPEVESIKYRPPYASCDGEFFDRY
jgi:hypothetical protein